MTRRTPAELVLRIPRPVRVVGRNVVWALGRASAGLRPLPDFLVIGAQKSGTTALYTYLRQHPGVTGPPWKEVSFFDRHYARGPRWYRGNFPLRAGDRLACEASPSYVFHPAAAERVASLLPEVRLIAVLRDPVDRAYSHYQHEVALGREPLSFDDALAAEDARLAGEVERMLADPAYFSRPWWDHAYVARGLYAEQLERWLAVFPAEQLLVLMSAELRGSTAETMASVFGFLGLPPHPVAAYPRVFERHYPPLEPVTRERLRSRFADPDARLEQLLGRTLAWTPVAGGGAHGNSP